MARINVDDELRADPRFHILATLVPRHIAYGVLICFWELGQSYWKKNHSMIPKQLAEQTPNYDELVRCGFAVEKGDFVYCSGATERWGFLTARSEAGKKSVEARIEKYGTAIPHNASNNMRTVTEIRTSLEQPPNKTEPSSSSSSSSSKGIKTYTHGNELLDEGKIFNSLPFITQEKLRRDYRTEDIEKCVKECVTYHSSNPNAPGWTPLQWGKIISSWIAKANPNKQPPRKI